MTARGTTQVAAVIGDPVAHSLSPIVHNAAFAAAGLDWVFVAFRVGREQTEAAVRGALTLGLRGLSVTMPGKQVAAAACDSLSPLAARLGSVNCITFRDGHAHGDNTDGDGILYVLGAEGVTVSGRDALVLGAGGAARSVAVALGENGARVTVAARRPAEVRIEADAVVPFADAPDAARRAAIVVNATPVGMGDGATPVDAACIAPDAFVVDAVYQPLETPLLAAVRARGIRAANGVGMLVGQAAAAFERWTGGPAPVDAMAAAVAAELAP